MNGDYRARLSNLELGCHCGSVAGSLFLNPAAGLRSPEPSLHRSISGDAVLVSEFKLFLKSKGIASEFPAYV